MGPKAAIQPHVSSRIHKAIVEAKEPTRPEHQSRGNMSKQTSARDSSSATTRAVTGVHAPESGWWRPEDDPQPFRYIQKGSLMPSLEGKRTQWVLELPLPPSRRTNLRTLPAISNERRS